MRLVLSPFVVHEVVGGKPAVVCRDPSLGTGRAVVRSPLVDWIVESCVSGREPAELVADARGFDPALVEQAISALSGAGILSEPIAFAPPPPTIELELTNRCNAACIMCPRQDLRPLGTMSAEVFDRVLALIRASGAGVALQGIGEPTLYPKLPGAIRAIRASLPEGAPFLMVTNGFRVGLDELEAYFAAGLSHVQWSFHSLDEVRHGQILGSTHGASRSRENLVAALARFADRISVNMVVMEVNRTEIAQIRRWLGECGLYPGRLRLIPVFNRGTSVCSASLSGGDGGTIGAHCLYTRKAMFVAWDGRVFPCSNDITGAHGYGHVQQCPKELMRSWWNDLVRKQVAFDMCARCDHASRRSLTTSWFRYSQPRVAEGKVDDG